MSYTALILGNILSEVFVCFMHQPIKYINWGIFRKLAESFKLAIE